MPKEFEVLAKHESASGYWVVLTKVKPISYDSSLTIEVNEEQFDVVNLHDRFEFKQINIYI